MFEWVLLSAALGTATPPPVAPTLIDPRDGTAYRTITVGGLQWMADNLRYPQFGSVCYDGQPANCARWGRLYDLGSALRACPPNWRVPSDGDWMRLEIALGASAEEATKERHRALGLGERLKVGGDTGFDALLVGYYDPHDKAFRHAQRTAAFWTSTLDGADDVSALAWHRDVDVRRTGIYRSKVNVTYKLPVRCVSG